MKFKITTARLKRVLRIGWPLAIMSILTLTAAPVRAQTQVFERWNSTIENFTTSNVVLDEAGNAHPVTPMVADSEGNSYITGSYSLGDGSNVYHEMLTIKYDPSGNILWRAWLGDAAHPAQGVEITLDSVGNVYTLGSIQKSTKGGIEFFHAKYNTNGVRQWVDYYSRPDDGQNLPARIVVSAAGNIYVTGTSSFESTTSEASAVLIKYDATGKQVWSKSVENCCNTIASVGVGVDALENVYWGVSEVLITGTDDQSYIYKYDSNGNLLTTTKAGGDSSSIVFDRNGNGYFVGSAATIPSDDALPLVAEFKSNGTSWQDTILANGPFTGPPSIFPNPDGTVFVSPLPGGSGLGKISASGAILWTLHNDGVIAVNPFGDIYLAGGTNVFKYDPSPQLIWDVEFQPLSHQGASSTAIAISGGNLIVTGVTNTGANASVTIDYVQDAASLTPSSLAFPNQVVNTILNPPQGQMVTFQNTAEQPLAFTITIDENFQQTNNCPTSLTLAPGASCFIFVTFAPISLGPQTGTLAIHDAWAGSPQTVKLTGTGTP
jgi:hypothetical protein